MRVFILVFLVVGAMCRAEPSSAQSTAEPRPETLCVDRCGDGTCQEIVCLGEGCPCAESPSSCAEDCVAKE